MAAGLHIVGLSIRNSKRLLLDAKPSFPIDDCEDSKLWAVFPSSIMWGFISRLCHINTREYYKRAESPGLCLVVILV